MKEEGLRKLAMFTKYNTFKNVSVYRDELDLPATLSSSSTYTDSITFTLNENASFLMGYMYTSDYSQYFQFLDSAYHDFWRQINNNNDNLIFTSAGLYYYDVKMVLNGNQVTFYLIAPRSTSGTPTVNHPTMKVPITFVEYRLAN